MQDLVLEKGLKSPPKGGRKEALQDRSEHIIEGLQGIGQTHEKIKFIVTYLKGTYDEKLS